MQDGQTALMMASGNGDDTIVALLLKHHAKVDIQAVVRSDSVVCRMAAFIQSFVC